MALSQSRTFRWQQHGNRWALTVALLLSGVSILSAQAVPETGTAAQQRAGLSGKVTDETGP